MFIHLGLRLINHISPRSLKITYNNNNNNNNNNNKLYFDGLTHQLKTVLPVALYLGDEIFKTNYIIV